MYGTAAGSPSAVASSDLAAELAILVPNEGPRVSPVRGVTLWRLEHEVPRVPVLYEPCVLFVLQGRKTGYLGDRSFALGPGSYLVLAAPLPFECESQASGAEPLLCMYVRLRRETIAELLAGLSSGRERVAPPRAIEAIPMGAELSDTVSRLLRSMRSEDDSAILGPQLIREIIYRALTGPQGSALRAMVGFDSHFSQICRSLDQIHRNYAKRLSIEHLARTAGMSQSVFHHHFKAVASTTPVQYLKAIRLHKARALMSDDGLAASSAAARVGYQSSSQFSREFKRYFGHPPSSEATAYRSTPMMD